MPPELREALESAINEASTPDDSPAEASPDIAEASAPEPSEPMAETAAPEKVEGDAESSPKEAEKPEQKAEAAPAQDNKAEIAKPSRVDRAPASWKGQAKGEWAAMPLAARQEIHRREMQIEKALQETAPARHFAEQFNRVVTPYTARMQAAGAQNPLHAVEELLKADYLLASAPKQQRAAFMAKLIKDYDVDVVELDNALVGAQRQQGQQAQPQGQDIQAIVQQQLQQALAPLMQREQLQRQQAQEQINHTVETMALDPKYPHFDEVRNDMADLIDIKARQGIDLSLEDAYAMATRMNPDVYAQTSRQATMQTANQQHAQAQRAKAAASSVSGSPAGGGSGQFVGNGDLRSTIEAAFGGARL